MSLKLLIDRKKNVVLFAEAGKEVVDFLFHILALPAGTMIRLLSSNEMVGSLGIMYDSADNLSGNYWVAPSSGSSKVKDSLLSMKTPAYLGNPASLPPLLLLPSEVSDSQIQYYCCSGRNYDYNNCCGYLSTSPSASCPRCQNKMSKTATFVKSPGDQSASSASGSAGGGKGGYVKDVVTYMVMDNLEVKPMSTISSITLLNSFKVTDLTALEEETVKFGMDEAISLLKASLQSKTVLTDVFLSKKKRKAVK